MPAKTRFVSSLLRELRPILPVTLSLTMRAKLDLLWVSDVRMLAQGIHEALSPHIVADIPSSVIEELRFGVKVLLSNMILLGLTKISASADQDALEQYYVLHTACLVFVMAECFVASVGFMGDEERLPCEQVLDAMAFHYSEHDFLDFSIDATNPAIYSMGQRTVRCLCEENAAGTLHKFGHGLKRYWVEGEAPPYVFPVVPKSEEFVRTRTNTPDSMPELV
ncbi:hypothetical protein C8J57DRAFT_1219541 [Mycena rebaudengoi]|nr:hypothetical protein C8J57DRAFT_1219541 [Mycena rebaudengoi]